MHCMECGAKLPQHAIHCPACGAAAPSELFMVYTLPSGSARPSATHRILGKKAMLQILEKPEIEQASPLSADQAPGSQAQVLPVDSSPTTEPLRPDLSEVGQAGRYTVATELAETPASPILPAPAEIFGEEAFYQYVFYQHILPGETGYGLPVIDRISPAIAPAPRAAGEETTIQPLKHSSGPGWIEKIRDRVARKKSASTPGTEKRR